MLYNIIMTLDSRFPKNYFAVGFIPTEKQFKKIFKKLLKNKYSYKIFIIGEDDDNYKKKYLIFVYDISTYTENELEIEGVFEDLNLYEFKTKPQEKLNIFFKNNIDEMKQNFKINCECINIMSNCEELETYIYDRDFEYGKDKKDYEEDEEYTEIKNFKKSLGII